MVLVVPSQQALARRVPAQRVPQAAIAAGVVIRLLAVSVPVTELKIVAIEAALIEPVRAILDVKPAVGIRGWSAESIARGRRRQQYRARCLSLMAWPTC